VKRVKEEGQLSAQHASLPRRYRGLCASYSTLLPKTEVRTGHILPKGEVITGHILPKGEVKTGLILPKMEVKTGLILPKVGIPGV